MQNRAGRTWKTANELLEQWSRHETEEWARLTGGIPVVRLWPPRLGKKHVR